MLIRRSLCSRLEYFSLKRHPSLPTQSRIVTFFPTFARHHRDLSIGRSGAKPSGSKMINALYSTVSDDVPSASSSKTKERLLILGSGWAADTILSNLDLSLYQVTVVSPDTARIYTPMLAAVAVGKLTIYAIMESVKRRGVTVYAASAEEIDVKGKRVECRGSDASFSLPFDLLVIAVGCGVQDFGTPGVKEHAIYFKTAQDALAVRNRVIECFELASLPGLTARDKARLLHFVVVGGGATGIELAAELSDLLEGDMHQLHPDLTEHVKLSVYDVASSVLPGYDGDLQEYARAAFERQNVSIETEKHIERVEAGIMHVKETGPVHFGMLVWSTGLDAIPLLKKGVKGVKQDDQTRNIIVDGQLRVLDLSDRPFSDVWAAGDLCTPQSGKLPPVGAVADQEARYIAKILQYRATNQEVTQSFEFAESRKVSYLGSRMSVQQKGASGSTAGRGAWALWREEYARTLSGKRRLILLFYWLITSLFGRDLVRI